MIIAQTSAADSLDVKRIGKRISDAQASKLERSRKRVVVLQQGVFYTLPRKEEKEALALQRECLLPSNPPHKAFESRNRKYSRSQVAKRLCMAFVEVACWIGLPQPPSMRRQLQFWLKSHPSLQCGCVHSRLGTSIKGNPKNKDRAISK